MRSRVCLAETRFGTGNAMQEAIADTSKVTSITWYTIPLPGFAGVAGGKHSFLKVTTCSQKYVLEKAQPQQDGHDGTFVSFWQGSNGKGIGASVVHEATFFRCNSTEVKADLMMDVLVRVCKDIGPYRLSDRNCHDAARVVFNFSCSERRAEVPLWLQPNVLAARVFGDVASARSGPMCNITGSDACVPNSAKITSESESRSDGSLHTAAHTRTPDGFSTTAHPADGAFCF